MERITISAGALALLAGLVFGQDTPSSLDPSATRSDLGKVPLGSLVERSAGVGEVDGQVIAGARSYRALFHDGSVEFHPALGARAATTQSLVLAFDDVRVGDEVVATAGGQLAAPRLGSDAVSYEHGAGVTERYEALPQGLEQSFVFEELPRNGGDLVVRMTLRSTLPLVGPAASDGGLRFEREGIGGVLVGAVTGIDATGATAPGWLRLDGESLELGLPGSFVAGAALPLVLDPLIGTTATAGVSNDSHDPDVAYDATNDVYLVVWEAQFAFDDLDIQAQRIDSSGALVGGTIYVRTTIGGLSFDPAVANVNLSDRFAVVWLEGPLFGPYDIVAKSVDADDGYVSSMSTLVLSAQSPDMASESTLADDEALLVWRDVGNGGIKVGQVNVAGTSPSLFGIASLSTSLDDWKPAISRSGGDLGQFLVVWQRYYTGSPGDHDPWMALVNRQTAVLVGESNWGSTIGPDEEDLACDGDGKNFIVAYEREATMGNGDNDIFVRPVVYTGSYLSGVLAGEEAVASDLNDDERDPAIAFNGETYTILWSDENTTHYDVYGVVIQPFDCGGCESQFTVASTTGVEQLPAIASQYDGGGTGDLSLIVWEDYSTTSTDGDIKGRMQYTYGSFEDLGGGCGLGGRAMASCARTGNANFRHTLTRARSFETVYLVIGFEELNYPCGSCVLVPDPWSGFVFATGTDTFGNAGIDMPIPSSAALVGLSFVDQWIDVSGTGCSLLSGDLSNAVRVTIEG